MMDLIFLGLIVVSMIGWSIGTMILLIQNRRYFDEQDKREAAKLKERSGG